MRLIARKYGSYVMVGLVSAYCMIGCVLYAVLSYNAHAHNVLPW